MILVCSLLKWILSTILPVGVHFRFACWFHLLHSTMTRQKVPKAHQHLLTMAMRHGTIATVEKVLKVLREGDDDTEVSAATNRFLDLRTNKGLFPAYLEGRLHGKTSSNGVEAMGNVDAKTKIRKSKVYMQLLLTVGYWTKMLAERKQVVAKYNDKAPPRVLTATKTLAQTARDRKNRKTTSLPSGMGRVTSHIHPGVQYIVDVPHKTCSCGKWQTDRFPCEHALVIMDLHRMDVHDHLHASNTTARWKEQ